jgi:hypothetical protein
MIPSDPDLVLPLYHADQGMRHENMEEEAWRVFNALASELPEQSRDWFEREVQGLEYTNLEDFTNQLTVLMKDKCFL